MDRLPTWASRLVWWQKSLMAVIALAIVTGAATWVFAGDRTEEAEDDQAVATDPLPPSAGTSLAAPVTTLMAAVPIPAPLLEPLLVGMPESAADCVAEGLQATLDPGQYEDLAGLEVNGGSEVAEAFASAVETCLSDVNVVELLSSQSGLSAAEVTCVFGDVTDNQTSTCLGGAAGVVTLLVEVGISEASAQCVSDQILQVSADALLGIDPDATAEEQAASVVEYSEEIDDQLAAMVRACLSESERALISP